MKKTIILFALMSFVIGNISAQDLSPNRRLKSGVWLKLGYDATFSNFLTQESYVVPDYKVTDFGVNFQLGTTFYIGPRIANKLRFGLDAAWLDFSYFQLNSNYYNSQNGMNFFLNFLEVGPIISFSPMDKIAFDLYGRVVPGYSLMFYDQSVSGSTDTYGYYGYHVNGLVGATFRFKVFSAGVEYNFGKTKYIDLDDSDINAKLITNNLRILLGFKF